MRKSLPVKIGAVAFLIFSLHMGLVLHEERKIMNLKLEMLQEQLQASKRAAHESKDVDMLVLDENYAPPKVRHYEDSLPADSLSQIAAEEDVEGGTGKTQGERQRLQKDRAREEAETEEDTKEEK